MARLVRMLAELVARLQLQHPQAGRGRLRVQRVQRLQRQRAARPLGGQEEQFVQAGLGAALSSGNKVPSVLPMPVGACASRQPPSRALR